MPSVNLVGVSAQSAMGHVSVAGTVAISVLLAGVAAAAAVHAVGPIDITFTMPSQHMVITLNQPPAVGSFGTLLSADAELVTLSAEDA